MSDAQAPKTATIHRVQQGEDMYTIATLYGFVSPDAIINFPPNQSLMQKRTPNQLAPDDAVCIPDKAQKDQGAAVSQVNTFQIPNNEALLRVQLTYFGGDPITDKSYVLTMGDQVTTGSTDGQGVLEAKIQINPDPSSSADTALLQIPDLSLSWNLGLGNLDPAATLTGAQARLNNLGIDCGDVDGNLDPQTQAALMEFQMWQNIPPTGALDDATSKALQAQHEEVTDAPASS